MSIDLTVQEPPVLRKPIRGQGGFQRLLRKLREQSDGRQLEVSAADLERLRRYSTAYGDGGFQRRTAHVGRHVTG
ncbi:MAG: hypothetical protein ABJA98_18410 [Acidobacteriota bacterium]